MKKTYKIDVDCANCANKMEDAANKTEGVKNEGQDPKQVMQVVRKNCKKVEDDCEIFL